MSKSSSSSGNGKFYIILTLIVLILAGLVVWKFQDQLNLKIKKINLSGLIPARKFTKSTSMYDNYNVSMPSEGFEGSYYSRITNVVCDGVSDENGQKHYFRISMTFESPDKKNAESIAGASEVLVADLREIVANLDVNELNRPEAMQFIKNNLSNKIKQKFGSNAVTNIYFEEILTQ